VDRREGQAVDRLEEAPPSYQPYPHLEVVVVVEEAEEEEVVEEVEPSSRWRKDRWEPAY
jgi:hypothetical protein